MIKGATLENNGSTYDMKTFVDKILGEYNNTSDKEWLLKWKGLDFYRVDNVTGECTTYTKDVYYSKTVSLSELEYLLVTKIYTPTQMKNYNEVDEVCEGQIKLLVENFNKGLTLLNKLTTIGVKEMIIDYEDLLIWQEFAKNVEKFQQREDIL